MADSASDPTAGLIVRRPTQADHARFARAIDTWWGERGRNRLPRVWLRNVAGTSWLAEAANGAPAGLLIGFVSPDHPTEAVLQLVAVRPGLRRHGVARQLVDRFGEDARSAGATQIQAVVWPGNPGGVAFLRAIGFTALEPAGAVRLYGTPAIADYDGEGEDRSIFALEVGQAAPQIR